VIDEGVGHLEDGPRGPIVLVQDEFLRVRIVMLEIEQVLDGRTSPGVDPLVGVADDADVPILGGQ
jgi:hypothetical protein